MQGKVEELIRRLRHSRSLPEISDACASTGTEEEVVHLLAEVLGSEETSTRWKASVALTGMGSRAVEELLRCLSDQKACVRSSAAWILGNIGDNRAVSPLLLALKDPSPEVRRETMEALGKLHVGTRSYPAGNGTSNG
ncbi:MAG: HEAT repeat domain-containing protein [Methanomicrobiales archaeon]|nr:HEAT repeat domain-containing protein [Methanomicrobiales archaeon]